MKRVLPYFLITMGILTFLGLRANAAELKIGDPAPMVAAKDQDGNAVNFSEVYKVGPTVVFFYPKADTPGCTKQACSLRDAFAELTKKGVQVLGVSFDDVAAQKAFKAKFNLPYPLIADPDGQVVAAFGVPSMGKFASRQAFLVKDGKIAWLDHSASTEKQAEDVMAALENLSKP